MPTSEPTEVRAAKAAQAAVRDALERAGEPDPAVVESAIYPLRRLAEDLSAASAHRRGEVSP